MTINDIHAALKDQNNKVKLDKIHNILKSKDGTTIGNYIVKNHDNTDPITVFTHFIINDYRNFRDTYYIDYHIRNTYLIQNDPTINTNDLIYKLPKEFHIYLYKEQLARIKKEEQNANRATKLQNLSLDEFSFLAYKAHLSKSKKLSSTLAVDQIDKLITLKIKTNDKQAINIFYRYLTLILEHTPVKSIDLQDKLIQCTSYKYEEFSPIQKIKFFTELDNILKQPNFNPDVHISTYFYQEAARQYNIPVFNELYTDRYSKHYKWITGIDKSTSLKNYQVEMVLSQIIILDYIITNLQKDSTCPYFIKAKEQLVNELSKPIYTEQVSKLVVASINTCKSSLASYQNLSLILLKDNK